MFDCLCHFICTFVLFFCSFSRHLLPYYWIPNTINLNATSIKIGRTVWIESVVCANIYVSMWFGGWRYHIPPKVRLRLISYKHSTTIQYNLAKTWYYYLQHSKCIYSLVIFTSSLNESVVLSTISWSRNSDFPQTHLESGNTKLTTGTAIVNQWLPKMSSLLAPYITHGFKYASGECGVYSYGCVG